MSGIEVIGCVAAVVSAFHGAAELIQIVKERKEKKKKKRANEVEQLVQQQLLHSSLVQGERDCDNCRIQGQQRFGQAFERGDAIAVSQLKDVVIHLQGEVIRSLQIALQVETAVLDVPHLHEAAILDRTQAVSSMQALCQRIMMRMPPPRQVGGGGGGDYAQFMLSAASGRSGGLNIAGLQRNVSGASADSFHTANMALPAGVSIPRRPGSRQQQDLGRMASVRSAAPSFAWVLPQVRRDENDILGLGSWPVYEDGENYLADQLSQTSLRDSARALSDGGSGHRPSVSTGNTSIGGNHVDSDATALDRTGTEASLVSPISEATPLTPASSAASSSSIRLEDADNENRYSTAPEVVTKEFESLLSPRQRPSLHVQSPPPQAIHPALLEPYLDSPLLMSPSEPEPLWSPLPRPSQSNNHHNFCPGAWETRTSVQEGLAIAWIQDPGTGASIPHWKCKHCQFRWQANRSTSQSPDMVLFNDDVRYRWLFLAKSHVAAATPHSKVENYSYGCIFCAAQGHETAVFESRAALMGHLLHRHKTWSLTPEVKGKTRCVVGGRPGREDASWDVNLPKTKQRKVSGVVGEFVVAAVSGISGYRVDD